MWIIAEYEAATLFSLKPATATSSGGRTLLIPTPFAIKMALLDVVLRTEGYAVGEAAWPGLQALSIAIRPSQYAVVNHTFTRILKPRKDPKKPIPPGTPDAGPLQRSIGYREYLYMGGSFQLALWSADAVLSEALPRWLAGIQSLGKRGSFIQIVAAPATLDDLPPEFLRLDGTLPDDFRFDSVPQQVDDTSAALTFKRANIYSGEKITLGKERLLHPVLLPYRRISSSRAYTLYVRSDVAGAES